MTSRKERIAAGPAPVEVDPGRCIVIKKELTLLTPVFGGGPESKADRPGDPVTPIRGAALRGQLRFWWRATRGGRYATLAKLREAEDRLWGTGTEPGLVSLNIDDSSLGRGKEIHYYEKNHKGRWVPRKEAGDSIAYLAFPLSPTDADARAGKGDRPVVKYDKPFRVQVFLSGMTTEDQRADVEAALWAWSCFGGVGARTRRGFGAVSSDVNIGDVSGLLKSRHIIDERPPEGVPSLAPSAGAQLSDIGRGKAEQQWKDLAGKLRAFRQGNGMGRNLPSDGRRPGRSRWPEPDFIRHDTSRANSGDPKHKERITKVKAAPRAAFGMPIIFHFSENINDLTLKPKDAERLASPLIIRPLGTRDEAVGIALVLGNRPNLDHVAGGVRFEQGRDHFPVDTRVSADEAGAIKPMAGRSTDPLLAFLAFAETKKR